ncbi:MAG: heavy metal translocating P-type ATPase [Dysgonamonadaceae bacterium]
MQLRLSKYPTDERGLESAISSVKGVNSVALNKKNKQITFNIESKYSDDEADIIRDIVTSVKQFNGEVATSQQSYPVLNMTCASCASSTQNILTYVPGVLTASVNYGNGKGNITYIPEVVTTQQMKTALQEIGYDMLIDEEETSPENLEKIEKQNYQKLKNHTIGAIALSIPLVIIGMFFMHMPYANLIMLLLATPILFIFGKRFFVGAWKQARHRSANMDTLVALSTGVSYLFSVFNMIYPEFWERRGLEAHVYFEAAGVIIAFILLGKLLEARAKGNTSTAIKKLMGLQPSTVTVYRNDVAIEIPIAEVVLGDTVLVKPGDRMAVDGTVTEGNSFVDESMISGEPIHVEKVSGAKVFAGTINQKGSFRFTAEKVGKDTLLAHIVKMVDEAQGSKAPVQGLVDKIASIFVPVVIAIAALSFILWMIFGGENSFAQALMAFVTVLVIACPCALGLATPTAIMVGIGRGAEEGILIKDAESLEKSKNIDVVVLDKTGTITEGKPKVSDIFWSAGITQQQRDILYSIEAQSEHPLAEAITTNLSGQAQLLDAVQIEQVSGKGIEGLFENQRYFIGNEKYIQSYQIEISKEMSDWISQESEAAHTVSIFSDKEKALAAISITDALKPSSKGAIAQLKQMNIDVAVYTGDSEKVVASLAKELGITNYKGGVLPDGKAELVKTLQQQGKVVAMVGDGINDSAALAQADVSIAMGKGSDIAMDVAKMTIISSDLTKIPKAIRLSELTVRTIHQNLFWAFIYNIIGIPIAAGVLFPFTGFMLNPMIAGAAMALSSVSVVTNSLRLKSKK